jgi:hypothetical protein
MEVTMSLLTSLLIRAMGGRAAARFEAAARDPVAAQQHKLMQIVTSNQDTEYGRLHGFSKVRGLESYQAVVPVVTYEEIRPFVDRMARGEANVLTAEPPVMFAMTSGTTGDPKLLPVTPTCRGRDHADQMRVWLYHAQRAPPRILRGKIMSLVSPAVAGTTSAGIPYGSTSGMMYRDMNPLVRSTYVVPYEAFETEDYDAAYYSIMRLGIASSDVTLLGTANPTSVQQLAETASAQADRLIRDLHDGTLDADLALEPRIRKAIEQRLARDPGRARRLEVARQRRDGKLLPGDFWPELALIACWKGGTVGGTVERFPEWFDPDQTGMPPVRDWGYLSSEARCSIPLSDDGSAGVLTVASNVFEFVPVDELEEHPEDQAAWTFLGVDGVETGQQYYVFITTPGGLYRYDINDVIEVAGYHQRTPLVRFVRKGRGMTSLTGEKLSENQVIEAMTGAAEPLDLTVHHFRAEPDADNMRYVFKVELEHPFPDDQTEALLERLDEALGQSNVEYKSKRASGRLHAPVLQVMKPGWHEDEKKQLAEEGKPIFQSKEVHLDAKRDFEPEPEKVEAEVELEESGRRR